MKTKATQGQIAVYLAFAILAICALALVAVDTFCAIRAKNRLENAGDAAAIAAARRQGEILNEIGRLNLEHILAAVTNDTRSIEKIEREQRRLALVEPVRALSRANDAAKKNGASPSADFSRILEEHADMVRYLYSGGGTDDFAYPESYPGAWTDYAAAIRAACDGGSLAVAPENIEFYFLGSHLLCNKDFYDAVNAENWCWFFFYNESLLNGYSSYSDWGAPENIKGNSTENSEIFSLHLEARKCALLDIFTVEELVALASRYWTKMQVESLSDAFHSLTNAEETWFFYDSKYWKTWFDSRRLASDDTLATGDFPILSEVKDEYNILGCSAVVRTEKENALFSTGTQTKNVWVAAAKCFGTLEDLRGARDRCDVAKGLVLPCFEDTRLIPVDAAQGGTLSSGDIFWVHHLRRHLPAYLATGRTANDCVYCAALAKWEKPSFRRKGIRWLKYHSGECIRHVGGSGGTGGTRHGH